MQRHRKTRALLYPRSFDRVLQTTSDLEAILLQNNIRPRSISTLGSSGAVASAPECLLHAMLGARQDIAAGAHGATNNHGLSNELVVHGDKGVVRGERAGGSLSMDQEGLELALHHVLLDL